MYEVIVRDPRFTVSGRAGTLLVNDEDTAKRVKAALYKEFPDLTRIDILS